MDEQIQSQHVAVGQKIGEVGNTGNSNTCHAHIVLYKNFDISRISSLGGTYTPTSPSTYAAQVSYDANQDVVLGGTVLDSSGNLVSNGAVYSIDLLTNQQSAIVYINGNGTYSFNNISSGPQHVIAVSNGQYGFANITLHPYTSNSLTIRLADQCVPSAQGLDANSLSDDPCSPVTQVGSDDAQFVSDVTIPDNSELPPATNFTKIWRVQNTGTSTWNSGYKLTFQSGYQMSAPSYVTLNQSVVPGATTDISVNMTSPLVENTYRGNWILTNPSGQAFGDQLFVIIIVRNGATPPTPGGDGQVKLFSSANYTGQIGSYGTGVTNDPNANSYSIEIPSGWSVRAYKGDGQSGDTVCWYQSIPNMQDTTWNNAIQSMQVFNYNDCGGGQKVKLYSLANYGNLIGEYNPGSTNEPNKTSYSMFIPTNWSVETYDQDNLHGRYHCWNASQANLQDTENWQLAVDSMNVHTTDVCPSTASYVRICTQTGGTGCMDIGADAVSLGQIGFGNDTLKSIYVAGSWDAVLFEDDNYQGRRYETNSSVNDLGGIPFGYGTSSIQVRKTDSEAFILYKGGDYNDGGPFKSDRSINNLEFWQADQGNWNDKTESIKVTSGYEIVACTDAGFSGVCGRANSNHADINEIANGLRDGLSSVQVCKVSCPPSPIAPVLLSPMIDASFLPGSSVTFAWNGDANSYVIEITGGNLTSPIQAGWMNSTQWTASNLSASTQPYYWHVRGWNPYGPGGWSTTQSFRVQDIAPSQVFISGTSKAIIATDTTYSAYINPADAGNITYTWTPTPKSGQGTSSVVYNFPNGGTQTISLTVQNTGGSASATQDITIGCPDGQYLGEYFDNKTLTDAPLLTRCESSINYDWGNNGPVSGNAISFGDGRDGDLTVASGQTTYTDNIRTTLSIGAAQGQNSISVADTTNFVANDLILIIQMQGQNTGKFEFSSISNVINSNQLTLSENLQNLYTVDGTSKTQIIKVPQYNNLTVAGTLTAHAWNGSTGGIIVFKANGTLNVTGSIQANGLGYRGGTSNYYSVSGFSGEGVDGVPIVQPAANSNGGGGGWQAAEGGAGGGGGGNGQSGVTGIIGGWAAVPPGTGGNSLDTAGFTQVYLGGGGGAGGRAYSNLGGIGGTGGGIILGSAKTISIQGTVTAGGTNGVSGTYNNPAPEYGYGHSGGGGGGAGGTIILQGQDVNTNNNVTVANGIAGNNGGGNSGRGGNGGNGQIEIEYCNSVNSITNTDTTVQQSQCGIGKDNFSARWTGNINFANTDTYKFTAQADDGIRVYFDNVETPIIDTWQISGGQTQINQDVTSGNHLVKVEYYENTGIALANLVIASISNHLPVVTQIPNQSIGRDQTFTTIDLNNYGTDIDMGDFITWSYSDNTNLQVSIDTNNITTITAPEGWTGSEDIRFIATDSQSEFASTTVTFTRFECPIGQYRTEYFNNIDLTGDPVGVQCESAINYDWTTDGPTYPIGPDLTVATGQTNYTDTVRSAISATTNSGQSQISLSSVVGFNINDEVLVIQMTDPNTGKYEMHKILSIGANDITLDTNITNTYTVGGNSKAQVIKIPQYNNVNVNGILTAHPWDGSTGGIVLFRASGEINVSTTGSITATNLGFAGGPGGNESPASRPDTGSTGGSYISSSPLNGSIGNDCGGCTSPTGPSNGGGGKGGIGSRGTDAASGGAGGSYGTLGQNGQAAIVSPNQAGGTVGVTYGDANLTNLFLGSGGGGGGKGKDGYGATAGNGGGIVFILGNTINVQGSLTSSGGNALNNGDGNAGGGGGGAGGSILVKAKTITTIDNAFVVNGGSASTGNSGGNGRPGGNGGSGRIHVDYCNNLTGTPGSNTTTSQVSCAQE